jgi:DNA-binding NarL/FixJ family response regulator
MTFQPVPTLNLMLIEDDRVFRQGLIISLTPYPDIQVVLEADSDETALAGLFQWFENGATLDNEQARSLDLILLSLDLGAVKGMNTSLALCQRLNTRYPQLPILLLSTIPDPGMLSAALQTNAMGYCQKGTAPGELVLIIRQIAAGSPNWTQGMRSIAQALTQPNLPAANPPSLVLPPLSALDVMRRNMRLSGVQQIDQAIAQLDTQLSNPQLSLLDELFLTGRRRELRAARWVVNRLLTPTSERLVKRLTPLPDPSQAPPAASSSRSISAPIPATAPTALTLYTEVEPQSIGVSTLRGIQAALFASTFEKLQTPLHNLTDRPLEIDILNDTKKRELLAIVLRQLEDTLNDLRYSNIEPAQLPEKRSVVLQNLWQAATSDFFGRYTTLLLGNSPADQLQQAPVDLVEILLLDADSVQVEMLDKIPAVSDFLAHLLFQMPLLIDNATYVLGSVEAMARLEALLENLIIQVANAVIQPLLNRFGDVVAIKQTFYRRCLLSTREIERFRNNLSWKYRVDRLLNEPTAIFESRYNLYVLQPEGIAQTPIYAPRNQELADLGGIRLAVTLALEVRDAIAPRVQSAVSFVGSGVVYVLTEVIGRGIGLIGRGVIKGIGNALDYTRFSRR